MAPPRRPEIVIGLDVGKSSHWACVVARDDEVLASKPVADRENAPDSLFAEFPGALVVVDQVRNIGTLALSPARGRRERPRRTCRAWPPTRPPGCSAAMPRPTSATRPTDACSPSPE